LIQTAGSFSRRLGLPRTLGQIYGLLYLSAKPLSLEEIASGLGISKASASTGTRQLSAWGAIRQVWVPGVRRDHFEAVGDIKGLVRNTYRELVKPRIDATQRYVDRLLATLEDDLAEGSITQEEFDYCQGRLQSLAKVQKTIQSVSPLLDRLL
jgi:DNA-binding transcriptional regulator GbsR (MarR family)